MPESLFNIWPDFGFESNPYSQETLTADSIGDDLLVGRDSESSRIQRLIGTDGSFPTVEGPIGVGKSSLLEVSIYRMRVKCITSARGELYLPGVNRLQPRADQAQFELEVFQTIAQTLIKYADDFERTGLFRPRVDEISQWLNSALFTSREVGGQVFGAGVNLARGTEPNTGEGFSQSGFRAAIRMLLEEAFRDQRGAVVLILDNLELLETVGAARRTLDQLRDVVFNIPNVRWVLCGSRGIVSRARVERLSAIFQAPLQLKPLEDEQVIAAIRRRIESFGGNGATPPVTPEGFAFLYKALNSNLRESLSTAQQYAAYVHEEYFQGPEGLPSPQGPEGLPSPSDLNGLLESWLFKRAEDAYKDAGRVQARHWQFFEDLCSRGGRAGSSEWEALGFGFQQQLVGAVTQLIEANLVSRETDPDDGTKTVNSVTPLGWLVYFFRARLEFPAPRS